MSTLRGEEVATLMDNWLEITEEQDDE